LAGRPVARYALALLGVLIVWTLRTALDPFLGNLQIFGPFFIPVILAGWALGRGPTILATVSGWLIGDYFFLPPRHTIFGGGVQDVVAGVVYLGVSIALMLVTDQMHRTRLRVELSERDLRARVQQESEERYRALFNAMDEGFCVVEMIFDQDQNPIDYRFLQTNPAFEKQTDLANAVGRRMRDLAPQHEEHWFQTYGQVALTGQPVRFQQRAAELHRWYDVYAFRFGLPEQRQVAILFNDITAHREAEAAVRQQAVELAASVRARDEALAQLNGLLANAPVGFAFFDREHCYARINDFLALNINGRPVEAHLGRPIGDDLPIKAKAVAPLLDSVFASGNVVDNVVVTDQAPSTPGDPRHWLTAWFPVRTPDGNIPWVGAIVLELTQQKRTEAALERRNQHLQLLHQASARLLVGQRPADLLRRLHPQMAKVFGAETFLLYQAGHGSSHLHLLACAGVSEEEKQKLEKMRFGRAVCASPAEALQPVIATHIQTGRAPSLRLLRKLGFRSYLYYPLILDNHLHGSLSFASRTRDDYDPTDQEFFHAIAATLAQALERGRLESELQRHASQLELTVQDRTSQLRETVAELEGFSYSLVHDMRAPLRAMLGYAGMLELETGSRLQPEETDLLRKISIAAKRMDQLVTDSLNYSKILLQDLPLGPVDLGALLRGMVETYPNLGKPQADIAIQLPHDLLVRGNEAALTQIFSNLLGNAVKFVAPNVHPRIRVWAETSGAARLNHQPSTCIFVADNGIGIPKEAHETIFGMFHRLHRADEYPGTGIGLALVKKSIERTGGRITLESEPGKGSSFCVELPLATQWSEALSE